MIHQRSEYTSKLIDIFVKAEPSQKFTYDWLMKAIGCPNRNFKGYMYSALKYVRTSHRIEFLSIRGVGIKRCDNQECDVKWENRQRTIRRHHHRNLQTLDCVDERHLSKVDIAALNVRKAISLQCRNEADMRQITKRIEVAKIDAEEALRNILKIQR